MRDVSIPLTLEEQQKSSCEANIKSIIENIAAINIEYEFLLWLWEAGGFNEHCSEEAIMV